MPQAAGMSKSVVEVTPRYWPHLADEVVLPKLNSLCAVYGHCARVSRGVTLGMGQC